MSDTHKLLKRQALWQTVRKDLSWSEKIRMAERLRATILKWSAKGDHQWPLIGDNYYSRREF